MQLAIVEEAPAERLDPEAYLLPGERDISDDEKWALHAANSEIKLEPDRLTGLKAERAGLIEESQRLRDIIAKLSGAQEAEREALSAIATLGQLEVAAMVAWASAGAVGDAPTPDMAKRETLARELAAAQVTVASSRVAGSNLESQMRDAQGRLTAIEAEIEAEALQSLETNWRAVLAEFETFVTEGQRLTARLIGFRVFLSDRGREFQDRHQDGTPYFRLVEKLSAERFPTFEPGRTYIDAAVEAWAAKLVEASR